MRRCRKHRGRRATASFELVWNEIKKSKTKGLGRWLQGLSIGMFALIDLSTAEEACIVRAIIHA